LPGIGYKSAQRLAFHLLKAPAEEAHGLADAIIAAKQKVAICKTCFNVSEGDQCNFCRDPKRDATLVCVVEEPGDIIAIERTQEFRGRYHVLGGHISPMDGIGPDDLRIRELLQRVGMGEVKEVIICTNPTVEGEATAIYLAGLIRPLDVRVTRIASGLPVGGDLEYADEVTLGRALEGRRDI
jgi:recombination protein RecR